MAVNLDRLVQFQRRVGVNGPYGYEYSWHDHGAPIRAARHDVSDGERAVAGWIESTLVSRFTVRSSAFTRDLTPIDQLTHDGLTWDIQGIKEAWLGRFRFLEITARARTDG
ncbi:phage head completion protein [Gemmobacter serpentinus]|uniref:phage head completion protein n=1 Tax=Gemmobacter serpentinus TaxID=2652247 RepID=UPI00124EDA85|nr:head-tail adaptor protein [Gemmobacter serpentinus]